ncbi:MAG: hypothetical protein JWM36_946 [Hyphomicrobiales bacterium]|nr:hypothetical protein [Hyphomicrobiales bacterium]
MIISSFAPTTVAAPAASTAGPWTDTVQTMSKPSSAFSDATAAFNYAKSRAEGYIQRQEKKALAYYYQGDLDHFALSYRLYVEVECKLMGGDCKLDYIKAYVNLGGLAAGKEYIIELAAIFRKYFTAQRRAKIINGVLRYKSYDFNSDAYLKGGKDPGKANLYYRMQCHIKYEISPKYAGNDGVSAVRDEVRAASQALAALTPDEAKKAMRYIKDLLPKWYRIVYLMTADADVSYINAFRAKLGIQSCRS